MTSSLARRFAFLAVASLLVLGLGGCSSNTWKEYYHPKVEKPPATVEQSKAAQVPLEAREWEALATFTPAASERVLGESRFQSQYFPGTDSLRAFAAELGATKVYWASRFSHLEVTPGYTSIPRDVTSQGVTTVREPDGSKRVITSSTTTTWWESIPYTRTDRLYDYLAIFVDESR